MGKINEKWLSNFTGHYGWLLVPLMFNVFMDEPLFVPKTLAHDVNGITWDAFTGPSGR